MKLKFKVQLYQNNALESVVDCFAGQVSTSGNWCGNDLRMNPTQPTQGLSLLSIIGFKIAGFQLTDAQLLNSIHAMQRRQNLPLSDKLVSIAGWKVNLNVEIEAATAKTYCYIKTFF